MKEILFITSYPLETEAAVRNRLRAYIQEGLNLGLSIKLISTDEKSYSFLEHINFEHLKIPEPGRLGSNFLIRTIKESYRSLKLIRFANKLNIKSVIITIPSMFLLFQSPLLKKKNVFLDIRDLTWEYLSENRITTSLAKKIFRYLAKKTVKKFKLIAVTNDTEKRFLLDILNISNKNIIFVPNGVSRNQFETLCENLTCKTKSITPIVSYIGNVGLAQNLTTLVSAAKHLPDVQFHIYGGGNDLKRVMSYHHELGLKNLHFFGRVSWDTLIEAYKKTHILYAQLSKDYSGAMPSKLYEYLSTGKHVVYGGDHQAQTILNNFENNTVIPPEDSSSLVDAINNLIIKKSYLQKSNRNIELIKEKFIRENSASNFYLELQKYI